MDLSLRPAKEEDAETLSQLAMRSKAYWRYDAEYLERCRPVLTIGVAYLRQWPVTVACDRETPVGFSALCFKEGGAMLDHLWIEPSYIGKGIGRLLFQQSVKSAQARGWTRFGIAADPQAEPFYVRMGARRIGEIASLVKPGFVLPLLRYEVPTSAEG